MNEIARNAISNMGRLRNAQPTNGSETMPADAHPMISSIGAIYRTSDYSLFKRLEGNRSVAAARANKIKKSIEQNGYILNPLVVNEKFEIVDGQGRFYALRELGMPIDFVIAVGAGVEQCIALNASGTLWGMKDYINSWSEKGNEDYLRLSSFINEFPEFGMSVLMTALTGLASTPTARIKSGTMVVTNEMVNLARSDLNYIRKFEKALSLVRGTPDHYIYAIIFARRCGADPYRLVEVVNRSELPPAPRLRNALDEISDLYNWKLSQDKKIYLHKEYEDKMADKYGWYSSKWGSQSSAKKS